MAGNKLQFPVDFSNKVKMPPQVGNANYPYRISAADLMKDFDYAALMVDETESDGFKLKETVENGKRTVAIVAGTVTTTLPYGATINDIIRYDGSAWVIFPAPPASGTYIPGVVDGIMQWMATEECV